MHPARDLDDVVHQRARLGMLAILSEVGEADFGYLKDQLGLTDGNLATHIAVLDKADFISVRKGFEGKRPRTWVAVTAAGRAAYAAEIEALRRIVREYGDRS
ncbi:MAG: hypothetical protein QOF57_252 [Frankiaceae bacterium]|jgi:DNA-binding MarR family transcriptional regulator|nr:hypothetical protein [Frankiaceae bacterium]MDQ1726595.1 hypothetical protein [Frankiaceae bacterium]